MNKKLIKYSWVTVVLILAGFMLQAQDDPTWESDGEINDAEIVIEKDKVLELPSFQRLFSKIPNEDLKTSPLKVDFEIKNLNFSPSTQPKSLRIYKVKTEPLEKLYNGQFKLGYGNFASPLVDVSYSNKRHEQVSFGANLKHESFGKGPVDEKNSASGQTGIGLFGKYLGENITLKGGVDYSNLFNHYYGYSNLEIPLKDTINVSYNSVGVNGSVYGSNLDLPVRYQLDIGYRYTTNSNEATESLFNVSGNFDVNVTDGISLITKVDVNNGQYNDVSVDSQRTLINFSPQLRFSYSSFLIHAGFNLALEDADESTTSFYPVINLIYPIVDGVQLFGGISGKKTFVSYYQVLQENNWIQDDLDIRNLNQKFQLNGGIQAKVGESLSSTAGFETNVYENMGFFVNSQPDSSQFNILYDSGANTNVFKLYANLDLTVSDEFSLASELSYFVYDTDQLPNAWHRPSFVLKLSGNLLLFDKLSIKPGVQVFSGIEGYNEASMVSRKLDSFANLGLDIDYYLSPRALIFVQLDNLLNAENQYFMNYPSRGTTFKLGFGYAF